MTSQVGTDDSAARKEFPMARGLLDYFPAALAAVARVSSIGNMKHNPGEDMHHARGKSMDHADCIMRHLADRGTMDRVVIESGQLGSVYEIPHSAYVAWRALALLQEELEAAGAPLARGAREAGEQCAPKPGSVVKMDGPPPWSEQQMKDAMNSHAVAYNNGGPPKGWFERLADARSAY
jgi:hypothetical protein